MAKHSRQQVRAQRARAKARARRKISQWRICKELTARQQGIVANTRTLSSYGAHKRQYDGPPPQECRQDAALDVDISHTVELSAGDWRELMGPDGATGDVQREGLMIQRGQMTCGNECLPTYALRGQMTFGHETPPPLRFSREPWQLSCEPGFAMTSQPAPRRKGRKRRDVRHDRRRY